MKYFLLLIGILFFSYNLNSYPFRSISEVIAKADKLYYEINTLDDFDKVINYLKEEEKLFSNNYEISWRLSRAISEKSYSIYLHYLSENLNSNNFKSIRDILKKDRKLEEYQLNLMYNMGVEAKSYIEKAKKINPNQIEIIYYEALANSMYALGKSILSILMEGLIGKYEHLIDILNKDNSYLKPYSDRLIGRYYFVLPWPKRDLEESEKYFREAIKYSPDSNLNFLFLGDTLWDMDKYDEAKKIWQEGLRISTGIQRHCVDRAAFEYCKNLLNKRLNFN